MPIPKVIYQTFRTTSLPQLTQWHIRRMRKRNPEYDYQFYDDARIDRFLVDEFDQRVQAAYRRIGIGALKADFFRYAVLYKKGGVYLDVDSRFLARLDDFILPEDCALISLEGGNRKYFIQFALFYEPGHPFLKNTLELIIRNIEENKYPHDGHKMTGPTAYTAAIHASLKENPAIPYRQLGIDYDCLVEFSYPMSKTFLYGITKKNHWRRETQRRPILNDDESGRTA